MLSKFSKNRKEVNLYQFHTKKVLHVGKRRRVIGNDVRDTLSESQS